jgi:hypothetical protein
MRGWVRTAAGTFRSDFAAEPELSDAALRTLATAPGHALTYTCVPPGSGTRIGIDRDDDGFPDLTEIDEDSDPLDRNSVPGNGTPFVLVGTRSLKLVDATPASRTLVFKASSNRLDPIGARIIPPPSGSAGDPTAHGARLVVYDAASLTTDQASIDLPAAGWRKLRDSGGVPTYRYRDRTPGAAIRSVIVTHDRISVQGGGPGLGYSLDEPAQGSIALRLAMGQGVRWCTEAPGATDVPARFVAQAKAARPVSCPVRP